MSVKYCPQCGAKNEAEAKFCTECGNRFPEETFVPATAVEDPIEPAPAAEPVQVSAAEQNVPAASAESPAAEPVQIKKKKKTGLVIVLIILALVIAAGAALCFTGNLDRMMATSKAGAGDYIGALESYENYLSRSGDKSTQAYTQASLYALSAGDADKALMYARSVPEKSEEADSLAEKAGLVLARNAIANKDWQGAVEFLRGIGGDEAKKLTDEANYHIAIEAAEKEEFYSAIALLENNSYEFAEDRLSEYRYNYGIALMNEGKYEEAICQFEQTDFADSDDLRGECYFKTSVDYAFLTDLKEVCLNIVADEASPESLDRAANKIGEYSDKLFNDSELAFFAEELKDAFLGEIEALNQVESLWREECQKNAFKCCAKESECLEIINELYPFDSADWEEIYSFFKPTEIWNIYISIIDQISADLYGITESYYVSETQQYIELPNNTDYQIKLTVWFNIYDENDNLLNRDEVSAEIPAHDTAKLVFNVENTEGYWMSEFWIDDFK